jgi:hypothetical protein
MIMRKQLLCIVSALLVIILVSGCREPENIPLDIPAEWQADGNRWWHAGTDTTIAFRNLETLHSMGIEGSEPAGYEIGTGDFVDAAARQRLVLYVKEGLIQLFRNQPEIVDSLFELHVVPKMANAELRGDARPVINAFKKEGYRILARHFRQPYSLTKLGVDVPLQFPDSLRFKDIQGEVFLQVYISDKGEPVAIEQIRGIHPTLDRIAIRAMTEMRWQPAYVVKGLKSPAIPSWARYSVRFASPPQG